MDSPVNGAGDPKIGEALAQVIDLAQIFACDLEGKITFWNRGAEQFYGWSQQEALGRLAPELLQTHFPQPLQEIKEILLRAGSWEGELTHIRRDGTPVVIASRWILHRDEQGTPLAILEVNNDITRLKRTEAALRTAHLRNTYILNNMIDGFFILDPQWRLVYANNSGVTQARKPREELLGRKIWDLFPNTVGTEIQRQWERVMAERVPATFEAYYTPYEAWFEHRVYPAMEGIAVFTRDITEQKQAEVALQESHERLASLLESISDTFTAIDREWRISYVNQHGLKVSGVSSPEEIVGKNFWELYPKLVGTSLEAAYRKAMEERVPVRFEVQGVVTGSWYETSVYPYADGISIFGRDMTERKQMEEALRASEERFARAFRASPDAFAISRLADGRLMDVNQSWEKLFGYRREEVIGHTPAELDLYADPADRQKTFELIHRQGFLRDYELNVKTRSDEIRQVNISLETSEIGGEPCMIAILRDITEQKRAELALRAREREFRAMFELSGSGVVQVDPLTSRFLRANRKYCEFTGYSEAELLNLVAPEVTHPEDRQRDIDLVWPVRQGAQDSWEIEKRYLRKDGRVVWGLVTGNLIRDEQGRPLHTIASVQDITALKEAEAELRHLRGEAGSGTSERP